MIIYIHSKQSSINSSCDNVATDHTPSHPKVKKNPNPFIKLFQNDSGEGTNTFYIFLILTHFYQF
jgi:hypothetical protein